MEWIHGADPSSHEGVENHATRSYLLYIRGRSHSVRGLQAPALLNPTPKYKMPHKGHSLRPTWCSLLLDS